MVEATSSMVLKYCNSFRYKMVYILSGYRNLLILNGVGFIDALNYYRTNSDKTYDPITMNTLLLIDAGYTELDEHEVRLYSNYIANVMNYDEEDFYMALRERANKIVFYENDIEKTTKQRINAMFYINRKMRRINSHA